MKPATYKDGLLRDGQLVVVSRDLRLGHYDRYCQPPAAGYGRLAIWPQLQDLYHELNHGKTARHAFDP